MNDTPGDSAVLNLIVYLIVLPARTPAAAAGMIPVLLLLVLPLLVLLHALRRSVVHVVLLLHALRYGAWASLLRLLHLRPPGLHRVRVNRRRLLVHALVLTLILRGAVVAAAAGGGRRRGAAG